MDERDHRHHVAHDLFADEHDLLDQDVDRDLLDEPVLPLLGLSAGTIAAVSRGTECMRSCSAAGAMACAATTFVSSATGICFSRSAWPRDEKWASAPCRMTATWQPAILPGSM